MSSRYFLLFFFFCWAFGLALPALATANLNGWQAHIADYSSAPPKLIVVDKSLQQLLFLERQSPIRVAADYICTTGQTVGDKQIEGDLKTPEGVYFVRNRFQGGLDYGMYGNEAYTLNYPNPVDRLRQKTGYGIWIHGRGHDIIARETQGCIAMNNADLLVLGQNLHPGLPVAVAEKVALLSEIAPMEQEIVTLLERKVQNWGRAWATRSNVFFEFYDAEAYSLASESFKQFKGQKERLFGSLKWITIEIDNIQTLRGPGYWVTWFKQNYKASNSVVSNGVRRLYWQQDDLGEFRIVGMEWIPGLSTTGGVQVASLDDPGTDPTIPAGTIPKSEEDFPLRTPAAPTPPVAQANLVEQYASEAATFVNEWRQAWQNADVEIYISYYAHSAKQGSRKTRTAIRAHKIATWANTRPKSIDLSNVAIYVENDHIRIDMQQVYRDTSGFSDNGMKTLRLEKEQGVWRIVQEDWSPL